MLSNSSNKNKKDDLVLLFLLLFAAIFIIWNVTSWGKQLDQIAFVFHKIQHKYMLIVNRDTVEEYKYYRNNAVLFARLKDKTRAYEEIDKAFKTVPHYIKDEVDNSLYRDKAQIETWFGDYKLAISDYARVSDQLSILDKCKMGILFGYIGNKRYAVKFCNDALQQDPNYYLAWACMADVYASVGKYDVAVKLYDYFIDNSQSKSARYYMDRAYYKEKSGDKLGHDDDVAQAHKLNPMMKEDVTIIADTMRPPKGLTLIPE
ncbi:MAG: hypothetical protein MJ231_06285 [bacterium]|nr:hypothetical protein [bacterium]